MEIWDLHCHLSGVPGRTPEERLGRMLNSAELLANAAREFDGQCLAHLGRKHQRGAWKSRFSIEYLRIGYR